MFHTGDEIRRRWEVHRVLRGGMGIIYIAFDHKYRSPCAIKTFHDAFRTSQTVAARFLHEAHAWLNLDVHENITQADSVCHIDGKPHLILEYVSGGDLREWIRTRRFSTHEQVVRMAIQFCDGMIHANTKGILVHRDIKPANCLITEDGTPKVA